MKIADMTTCWKLLGVSMGLGLAMLPCAPVYAQQDVPQEIQKQIQQQQQIQQQVQIQQQIQQQIQMQQQMQQNVPQDGRPPSRRFPRFFRQMPIEQGQATPPSPQFPFPPEALPDSNAVEVLQRHAVRLTPEQRRQLRQDIREHGRELYRVPPPPWPQR